jgi:hypothetical protein
MKMLVWSGTVQGFSTPALMLLIMLLTNNPAIMGNKVNSRGQSAGMGYNRGDFCRYDRLGDHLVYLTQSKLTGCFCTFALLPSV